MLTFPSDVPGEEADGEYGGDAAREGESRPALPRARAPAQPSPGRNSDIPLERMVTAHRLSVSRLVCLRV
jgi:hypothetical protein